jgi:hypothetical protein
VTVLSVIAGAVVTFVLMTLAGCALRLVPTDPCDACLRGCGDEPDCEAECAAKKRCPQEGRVWLWRAGVVRRKGA